MEFDYKFYLALYPDLKLNNINNESSAYNHFIKFGNKENRITSIKNFYIKFPNFNYKFYKNFYNDLKNLDEYQLIVHYIKYGKAEKRLINKNQLINNKEINKNELLLNKKLIYKECNNVLFNIIIRTSLREKKFFQSLELINNQTYKNFKIYISYDNKETLNYLKKIKKTDNIKLFNCIYIKTNKDFHWNNYCNKILKHIKDGYIIFLDDDDIFTTIYSLEIIKNNIKGDKDFLFWKYYREDRIIYSKDIEKVPEYNHITSCGFTININKVKQCKWCDKRGGDYFFLKNIFEKNNNLNKKFLNYIITQKNVEGYSIIK